MINHRNPILIVEDSPEDYELLLEALKVQNLNNTIIYCDTGDEAIDFLYRHGKYSNDSPELRPIVILLDLNLPGTDGRDVLSQLKHDDKLKNIPVIVMTSSENARDEQACIDSGATAFLSKPIDTLQLARTLSEIKGTI